VSDANEKPIACPCCGGEAHCAFSPGVIRCDGCGLEIIKDTYGEAIAAWNRRHNPYGNTPLAFTLAAYLLHGDSVGLQVAKDVVMELGLWEQAEGELGGPVEIDHIRAAGFTCNPNVPWEWSNGNLRITIATDTQTIWHTSQHYVRDSNGDRARLDTLRQFLALCTLFGITPKGDRTARIIEELANYRELPDDFVSPLDGTI
jgi:hypothetical protein